MLRSHNKKYHRGRKTLSAEEEVTIKSLHGDLRSSKSEKHSQPPGQKPVDGIEVLPGFVCPGSNPDGSTCSGAFPAESSFTRHLATHPSWFPHSKPDPGSCACYIQTLFTQGNLQSYFSVETSLSHPDPPRTSVYADGLKLLRDLPNPQIPAPNSDKERESIHWYTRWPELLATFCNNPDQVNMLRSLTLFPEEGTDQSWLVRVKDHGSKWWVKAELEHLACSDRASRLLKSPQMCVFGLLPGCSSANVL